jgi:hypothetical protein
MVFWARVESWKQKQSGSASTILLEKILGWSGGEESKGKKSEHRVEYLVTALSYVVLKSFKVMSKGAFPHYCLKYN